MDFEKILSQWEEQSSLQRQINKRERPLNAVFPDPNIKDSRWLEMYPPGTEALAGKNCHEEQPVSQGSSVWLRRAHQATLDLHGLNGAEARAAMHSFIRSMQNRNLRKGLIIHGKGLHSQKGSVLKPLVREYLEESGEVGIQGRASGKDGGSGATWFILRQRSR